MKARSNSGKNIVRVIKPGIIENIIRTDFTYEVAYTQSDKILAKINQFYDEGKPVLVLHNALEMGVVSHEARKHTIDISRSTDFDKMAIAGKGVIIRLACNLMMQAIGKGGAVKFFHNRQEAIDWLST